MGSEFLKNGYHVYKGAISKELCSFGRHYLDLMMDAGNLPYDIGGEGKHGLKCISYGAHGVFYSETLSVLLKDVIEEVTDIKLFNTYSYSRIYEKGSRLTRHTDRPSCEISTSLNLGYDGENWPLYIRTPYDEDKEVILEEGDMLIYKGIERPHWRDKYNGKKIYQIFLHYVNQAGPYKDWKFDKREHLGHSHTNN